MMYCSVLGFIPFFAILEQNVCLQTWGGDLRQLHLIDLIVLLYDMLEILLPMERDHRHPVLIKEKESGMSVNDRLDLRLCSCFQDPAEASLDLRRHRHHALSAFGLGVLDHIFHL